MFNLLAQPIISAAPLGPLTLPGVLAALARDEVDDFPALRAHQGMFWHMFLVQLAALALHGAGETEIPGDEETWRRLLRGMTKEFPDDEPWCLVVEDWSKPAFMQAAVPDGVKLGNPVPSPDALDLLITSKNHDLKQAVARSAAPEEWLHALVTLQTGEGYGGAGNAHGVPSLSVGRHDIGRIRLPGGSRRSRSVGCAPSSRWARRNYSGNVIGWTPRSAAICSEVRPSSRLRATRTTSSRNSRSRSAVCSGYLPARSTPRPLTRDPVSGLAPLQAIPGGTFRTPWDLSADLVGLAAHLLTVALVHALQLADRGEVGVAHRLHDLDVLVQA